MLGVPARAKQLRAALLILTVLAILHACGDGAPLGNTSLNVIVPDGGADMIDIQTVEYTVQCDGNDDTFLDGNDSFVDELVIEGSLQVVDGRTSGSPPVPTEVWQAFMDLPPGPCLVQLRARDNNGEQICVANDSFFVAANTTTKVNMLLLCGISFQAPVGMADLDATFSFVVGNFCPDIFIFNVLDNAPAAGTTEVQVRGRDGDSTCGNNCDPQTCDNTVIPPVCTPGPDPGVSIIVTTDIGTLDCDQDATPDGTSCTFSGDQFNTGDLDFVCPGGAPPGTIATLGAVITDGDIDCDETQQLQITCGGP